MDRNFKTKIISWLVSIIIVLLIFVGIIGLLFPLLIKSAVEHITVTSIIFSLIGLAIMISSKYWPILNVRSFVGDPEEKKVKQYDYLKSMIIGLTFLMSGFLYAYLRNYNAMIISFLIGIVLYRLIVFYLNLNNKKTDT
ncbi:hypothetical protein ACFL1N_12675 [Thermodesulfobacteriota bacterium]